MPRPVLTRHAREQMDEREVTEEQVYHALAHEIRRTPGLPGTVWIHGLVAGGETLKVCVTVDQSVITTVAWPGR
jgi:Domain of unknown function (DUF4258)